MAYSFLQQSIRDVSLVGWWDFRRFNGDFLDLSGQGNDGTPSNVVWGGGGIQLARNNGIVTVANAAELDVTALSLIVVGDFANVERAAGAESTLVAKSDGVAVDEWMLEIDETPQLRIASFGVTRTLGFNWHGARSLGFTLASGGATPIGYMNGLSQGNFSGAVTVTLFSTDLHLGNRDAADRSMYNPLLAVCLWNRVLTASEMSIAHGELMALPGGEH